MSQSPLQNRTATSAFRSTLTKSLGFSREYNSRNLEYYWYLSWNHTLVDLISDIPNLFVAPQFPLWFTEEDEENIEGPEDGDDFDEDSGNDVEVVGLVDEPHPDMGMIDDEDMDIGNTSFSSGTTVAQPGARSQLVDFAIVHVAAVAEAQLHPRYGGWRITGECVPVLVEEKRYSSRSLAQAELILDLNARLEEARAGLKVQAAHLFQRFPDAQSVIAIAAAGPYWSNTTISRKDIISSGELNRIIKDGDYPLQDSANPFKWTIPLLLDTHDSNQRFQIIYDQLRMLLVMAPPES